MTSIPQRILDIPHRGYIPITENPPDVYIHPCCQCPETDELSIQCDRCAEWWHKKCLVLPRFGWSVDKIEMAIRMAFACPACDELITSGLDSVSSSGSIRTENSTSPEKIKVKKEKDPLRFEYDKGIVQSDESSSEDLDSESFEEYNPRLDMSDRDSTDKSSSDDEDSPSEELKQEVIGLKDDDDPYFNPNEDREECEETHTEENPNAGTQVNAQVEITHLKKHIIQIPRVIKFPPLPPRKKPKLVDPQTSMSGNFKQDLWVMTEKTKNPLQLVSPLSENPSAWLAQNNFGHFVIKEYEEVTLLKESSTILKVLDKLMPQAEQAHQNFEVVLFLVCLLIEIDEQKTLEIINDLVTPWLRLDNRQTLWCLLHDTYDVQLRIEPGYEAEEDNGSKFISAPRIPSSKRRFKVEDAPERPVKRRKIDLTNTPAIEIPLPERSGVIVKSQGGKKQKKSKQAKGESEPVVMKSTTSKYCGVSWRSREKKWLVQIACKGKTKNIGVFNDEEEAARAWDEIAMKLRGHDTPVNFPRQGQRKIFKKSSFRQPRKKKEKSKPKLKGGDFSTPPRERKVSNATPPQSLRIQFLDDSLQTVSSDDEYREEHFDNVLKRMELSREKTLTQSYV